jgi:hypothetical protein
MPFLNGKIVNWQHRLKIKHLFTESDDPVEVKKSMTAIARVLDSTACTMSMPGRERCAKLSDIDKANRFLSQLYDFCDANLIWVE